MKYKEITVYTTTEASEIVADILFENCGGGVGIYDKSDIIQLYKSDVIWDYIDENIAEGYDGTAAVKGFVPADSFEAKFAEITGDIERLKNNSVIPLGSMEITVREIDDADWYEVWKKHFKPLKIKDITICPVWCGRQSGEGKTIYINPGTAFGTGEHETTKMCLELMQEYDIKGRTVADIGCGSGILGVSAAVSGAKKVYMCDIDETAVKSAESCALLNNVSHITSVSKNLPDIKADTVLMNIVADVLIGYARKIKEITNQGGVVILSGIIESRKDDVISAYTAQGFKEEKRAAQNGWRAVSLKKL